MRKIIYTIPYTYLLGWSNLNLWYYGARYAKGCNPEDLCTTYFTSSKHVKTIIETNGLPDIIEIRKIFETSEKCIIWETKCLRRLKAKFKPYFINKNR